MNTHGKLVRHISQKAAVLITSLSVYYLMAAAAAAAALAQQASLEIPTLTAQLTRSSQGFQTVQK
jgi:hypothetical protein